MTDWSHKSSTCHATNIQHQRIPLEDDYEVVQARTSSLRWNTNLPVDSARDQLRGFTSWDVGSSWAPEDDPEFTLDQNSEEHDRELERELGDVLKKLSEKEKNAKKKKRKTRSQASVRQR